MKLETEKRELINLWTGARFFHNGHIYRILQIDRVNNMCELVTGEKPTAWPLNNGKDQITVDYILP